MSTSGWAKKSILAGWALEREIIGRFRKFAACSVDLAKSLPDLGLSPSPVFNKLLRRGIVVHMGDKTYFLDERALMKNRLNRVKWGVIILLLILTYIIFRIY
jgi:hypothetical protein